MYLNQLMLGEKYAFYSISKSLVFIDNTFSREEQTLVSEIVKEMELDEEQIPAISLDDAVNMLSFSSCMTRRGVFFELVGISLCDRVMHKEETKLLDRIAVEFSISLDEKGKIISLVKRLFDIYQEMDEIVRR